MADLQRIEDFIKHVHIDATLYTESDIQPNCTVSAMKCFLLELHVIAHEAQHPNITLTIENLLILANSSLSSKQNITEPGCKQCEQLEEKDIDNFLKSFKRIVNMFTYYDQN